MAGDDWPAVVPKYQEGAAEVGASDAVVEERGSGCPGFGNVIRGSCAGSLVIWVGYVGDVPMR